MPNGSVSNSQQAKFCQPTLTRRLNSRSLESGDYACIFVRCFPESVGIHSNPIQSGLILVFLFAGSRAGIRDGEELADQLQDQRGVPEEVRPNGQPAEWLRFDHSIAGLPFSEKL